MFSRRVRQTPVRCSSNQAVALPDTMEARRKPWITDRSTRDTGNIDNRLQTNDWKNGRNDEEEMRSKMKQDEEDSTKSAAV